MKIKKIIALACAMVCSAVPYVNYAVSESSAVTVNDGDYKKGTYENLQYIKYSDHAEITGCKLFAEEVTIPDEIEGVPVTSIGEYAFYDCSGLTSITIPDSITEIGNFAFEECTGLTSITIPESVTYIRNQTFSDCTSLTSITIPDSVTKIGFSAFENTEWYNNQPDGVVYAGKVAYKYKGEIPKNTEIVLKDDTVGIAVFAFENCTGLTSINIPDSVKSIEYGAFQNCSNLKSITIPDSVTSIKGATFYNCNNLKSINIPDGVKSIEWGAFYGCSGLKSITIPDSVISIKESVFSDCTGLTSITIPDSVALIEGSTFSGCKSLTSITIPDSVTSIGGSAFANCNSLTSITIENPECEISDESYTIWDTATIYGYENSTAQKYAEKYSRNFVSLGNEPTTGTSTAVGDANGDGTVDVADVVSISSYVADPVTNTLSEQAVKNCDVHNTGDGLTPNDSLMIQQYIAGIITEL